MTIELTGPQEQALAAIRTFLADDSLDAFILRGSAGTGKTTLIAKLTDALDALNLSYALLAPTGRAARIIGNKLAFLTGKNQTGTTVHSTIYSLDRLEVNEEAESSNDPGLRMIFPLRSDEPAVQLLVIDEASMLGDRQNKGDVLQFGSGRLLHDVVSFVRARRPGREHERVAKLLFVGDQAQLPPIGEETSPALSEDYLRSQFKLRTAAFELSTVMRQAQGSAILERATALRDALAARCFNTFTLPANGSDIRHADAGNAIDLTVRGLHNRESCAVVVHSNAAALDYNRSIRERLWGSAQAPMQVGDVLLVNRNSSPLSNGDLVKVVKTGTEARRISVNLKGEQGALHVVELIFKTVTMAWRDANGEVVQLERMVLENLLDSPQRDLSPLEQRALLVDFRRRHPDLKTRSDEFRQTIKTDPLFNALQVKYGYALTCHKAQGGEWDSVVVDFSATGGQRNADFFRWAYTAMTRASRRLVAVNPPDFSADSSLHWSQPAADTPTPPAQDDAGQDADWQRFSFSAATAPLMRRHRELRARWQACGISIERLQHLQYCERYLLARDGRHVTVQYHYDKKYRIGRASLLPGARADAQLESDALAVFDTPGDEAEAAAPERFIEEFLAHLDAALAGSGIHRTGCKSMPYRLRVSLADASRRGDIDFTHDSTSTWTTAQEVGGPGGSHGLYGEVQRLMSLRREAS